MLEWLFETLIGWPWCRHKWTVIDRSRLHRHRDGGVVETGDRLILQCEKCGEVKKRDLI